MRDRVAAARADIALAVGTTYVRSGHHSAAIEVLAPALERNGMREDLARELALAYRGAGRADRADDLAREFRLSG